MSADMDLKATKVREKTTADRGEKLQERLKEKWPEYRETESAGDQREILISHYRRMATRAARAWLPPTGDQELRAVESLLLHYIDAAVQPGGVAADMDGDTGHRVITQGLTNLGNALSNVLFAVQGGNQPARLAAIEWVSQSLERDEDSVHILEASADYQGAGGVADDPSEGV